MARKPAVRNPTYKLTHAQRCACLFRLIYTPALQTELSREFGVAMSLLTRVLRGEAWFYAWAEHDADIAEFKARYGV